MAIVTVANQAPGAIADAIKAANPDVNFIELQGTDRFQIPAGVEILVAAPGPGAAELPRPEGWPFDLKWIHFITVGMDFYPPWMFEGTMITTARGTTSVAIAEFVLASILAVAKRFPNVWINKASDWHIVSMDQVKGRTVGVVGYGSVAQAFIPLVQALGMKVLVYRRSNAPIDREGVERTGSLQELFARSDDVVLAAPSTDETHGMVDRALLAQAKPGLHLINIARGKLIDDDALLEALDTGQVGFASLDVAHPEPLPEGHPYYDHPSIHLSPHTCVVVPTTNQNIAVQFRDYLKTYIAESAASFQQLFLTDSFVRKDYA